MTADFGRAPSEARGDDFFGLVTVEQIEHPIEFATSFRIRTIHQEQKPCTIRRLRFGAEPYRLQVGIAIGGSAMR